MPETEGHGRLIKQEKLLAALRGGNTRKAAADYAEIHIDTFHEWLKDPKFSEDVRTSEAAPEITCASSILAAAKKDWRAAAWWLERRRHAHWKEIKQLNVRDLSIDQLVELAGAGEDGVDSPGDRLARDDAAREGARE